MLQFIVSFFSLFFLYTGRSFIYAEVIFSINAKTCASLQVIFNWLINVLPVLLGYWCIFFIGVYVAPIKRWRKTYTCVETPTSQRLTRQLPHTWNLKPGWDSNSELLGADNDWNRPWTLLQLCLGAKSRGTREASAATGLDQSS